MALSRKRRIFRGILFSILAISLVFIGIASYYRASYQRTASIAPILFKIDVMQFQARAFFSDKEGKYKIARRLYRNTFFSDIYATPAIQMMDNLVADNYAPALAFMAKNLIRQSHPEAQRRAIALYKLAALQNHKPAIEALNDIKKNR